MTTTRKLLLCTSVCMSPIMQAVPPNIQIDTVPDIDISALSATTTKKELVNTEQHTPDLQSQAKTIHALAIALRNTINSAVANSALTKIFEIWKTISSQDLSKIFAATIGGTSIMAEFANALAEKEKTYGLCNLLKKILTKTPELATLQDEKGNTIFHHLLRSNADAEDIKILWNTLSTSQKDCLLTATNNWEENIVHLALGLFPRYGASVALQFLQHLRTSKEKADIVFHKNTDGQSALLAIADGYDLSTETSSDTTNPVNVLRKLKSILPEREFKKNLLVVDKFQNTFLHLLCERSAPVPILDDYKDFIGEDIFKQTLRKEKPLWQSIIYSCGCIDIQTCNEGLQYFYNMYSKLGDGMPQKWLIRRAWNDETQAYDGGDIFFEFVKTIPDIESSQAYLLDADVDERNAETEMKKMYKDRANFFCETFKKFFSSLDEQQKQTVLTKQYYLKKDKACTVLELLRSTIKSLESQEAQKPLERLASTLQQYLNTGADNTPPLKKRGSKDSVTQPSNNQRAENLYHWTQPLERLRLVPPVS